jgi:hypothetical protein
VKEIGRAFLYWGQNQVQSLYKLYTHAVFTPEILQNAPGNTKKDLHFCKSSSGAYRIRTGDLYNTTALEAPLGHPGPEGRFFPSIICAKNPPETIRIFYTAI